MSKLNRVLGGALLAFALISSQVARADDEKAVNLIVKPKVGHVTHSKTVIKTSVMGMDVVVNETQKGTVQEIKENGDVVEEMAIESIVLNIGGMDRDQPGPAPTMVTRDKFGKIKDYKAEEAAAAFMAPEISKLMASLSTSLLTDKAVKTNDTWQTELENPAVKGKKIVVKDTYLGLDKVDGKDYWKIKQTAEAVVDADGNKMSYDFTVWIDPTTGDAFKVDGTVKDVPTQIGPVTMQITSTAVKADDKAKPEVKKEAAKP